MRRVWFPALLALLAGCPSEPPDTCENVRVFADLDGDGFGGEDLGEVCHPGEGEVEDGTDCDDDDARVHPGAEEKCNGVDEDCVEGADQGLPGTRIWYADEDRDGFGAQYPAQIRCGSPGPGWAEVAGDCDDEAERVYPGRQEVCNGVDDDCDQLVDEWDDSLDPSTLQRFWEDSDGDGAGDSRSPTLACALPAGYSDNDDDCAPADPFRNPDATEICNGSLDDDCDGRADDADGDTDPDTMTLWFLDADRDGWGLAGSGRLACAGSATRVDNDLDCDDTNRALNLDDADRDTWTTCDGDCADADPTRFPFDLDGDGFTACDPRPDCAPADPGIHPDAAEIAADGVDQDCDAVDDCFLDLDRDGHGRSVVFTGSTLDCSALGESSDDADCDDADPDITIEREWYGDGDGDGYGGGAATGFGCFPTFPGDLPDGSDCDDGDPTVNPGADEICTDAIDQDCDGSLTCCALGPMLEDNGWPANLPFDYCWFAAVCVYVPPAGATFTLAQDGTFTYAAYTGTWWIDDDVCELSVRFDSAPNTIYVGAPTGVAQCVSGTMDNNQGSTGTWMGCF